MVRMKDTTLARFDRDRFGSWVRQFRSQHRFTQQMLADMLGCTRQYISRVERGKAEPSLALVFVILQWSMRSRMFGDLFSYHEDFLTIGASLNNTFVGEFENV